MRCTASLLVLAATVSTVQGLITGGNQTGCETQSKAMRSKLQSRLAALDVECEEMCKRLNEYPNCQCPGFAGNPASAGDMRGCMDKYCQDPSTPCSTDGPEATTHVEPGFWVNAMDSQLFE